MQTATSSGWIDRRQHADAAPRRREHEPRELRWAAESLRLAQENQVLRQSCAELTAAAETWIRLYEAALARANAAEAKLLGGAQGRTT